MDFHFHSNLNRLLLVRVFHLGSLRIPFTREWCMENGYFSKQPQRWKRSLTDKSVSFSWGQSRTRRACADRSRQGRRQEFFLLDASKVLTVETILMKMINFRLSWHLSSILVNVSWLDSCMGSLRKNTFSLKAKVIQSTGESYKGRPDLPFRFLWSPALIPQIRHWPENIVHRIFHFRTPEKQRTGQKTYPPSRKLHDDHVRYRPTCNVYLYFFYAWTS